MATHLLCRIGVRFVLKLHGGSIPGSMLSSTGEEFARQMVVDTVCKRQYMVGKSAINTRPHGGVPYDTFPSAPPRGRIFLVFQGIPASCFLGFHTLFHTLACELRESWLLCRSGYGAPLLRPVWQVGGERVANRLFVGSVLVPCWCRRVTN